MSSTMPSVVVITGAASGIGLGIATHCLKQGMCVVMGDIEQVALEKATLTLEAYRDRILPLVIDVTKESDLQYLAQITFQTYGKTDFLINNAGVSGPLGPIWEIPIGQLRWTLDVNLMGVIYSLRSFIPKMLQQKSRCHIVNVSSHAGLVSNPHLTPYQITKHAIVTLSESLQQDLKLQNSNIDVSIFFPYFVRSNLANSERRCCINSYG